MKIPVGILGATGTVGQRFIQLLEFHPWFYVVAVGASERSAGKTYEEATVWKMTTSIPENIAGMIVQPCEPHHFKECKIVFSGLDASVAGDIELAFIAQDLVVFSNAKNHRMNPKVPLIVPLVNTDHFDMISSQRKNFKLNKGFLVTNANCSTTGVVVALKALSQLSPLKKVVVTTMQAISGAGYPGVPSLDILGNVVPFISGEEEKIETEVCKILGKCQSDEFHDYSVKVSASCNRVPVIDGHTANVFIEFDKAPSMDQIQAALGSYTCEAQTLKVPSAPKTAIVLKKEKDRPQPRLDVEANGQSIVVGRLRSCPVFDLRLTILSHNTILGAAGSSIMNAEVAVSKGLIE